MKRNLDFNNQRWTFRPARLKYWGQFVQEKDKLGAILVAGLGEFERHLAPNADICEVQGDYNNLNTSMDLHLQGMFFDTIYCFEVLEHLVNPGHLLKYLRYRLNAFGSIYVSFPTGRPIWLWTDGHFHEFQRARAEIMFEMCGLRIERKTLTPRLWMPFFSYFKGIRPIFRLFWPLRCAIYELRRG